MKKRLIKLFIISSIFCTSLITLSALASSSGVCGENVTWSLDNNGVLTVQGNGRIANKAFENNLNIQHVIISDGITSIGDSAFIRCYNLKTITLPTTLTVICREAFMNCTSLQDIVFPESLKTIEYNAFWDCESFESVILPNSLEEVKTGAFRYCKGLKNVSLSNKMTIIAGWVFAQCDMLESVFIPENITTIDDHSFWRCTALKDISLPDSILTIHKDAFIESAITTLEGKCTSTFLNDFALSNGYIYIPKHKFNDSLYFWSSDNENITAQHVCFYDSSHVETTETVTVTAVVTKPATCTEKGQTTYTSSAFTNSAFSVQTKTLTNINALGHQWNTPTYNWSADNTTVTARRICAHDASHVETETASVTAAITQPATCTEEGQTTYTSSVFANSAFAIQTKTLTNIDALGHDWGAPVYTWSADNSKVMAKRICSHDSSHVETETVNVTAEVTKPATCTEKGQTTYTSSAFANTAFSVQTKTLTNINAIGHTIVADPAVAPTDCRSGLTEGSHCSVCGEILTAQQIIHPLLWEIDETGGRVTILRYYGSETNVTIPSYLESLPVWEIASGAFPYSNCPIRIFIPHSVQSISNTAFARNITVYCHEYSEADYWSDEVGYTAIYVDNTASGTFYRITMPDPFTMEYGETRNLGAVVWPMVGGDSIYVTSSDSEVIDVNGDMLTAMAVGQATVTLTAGGKSADVVITVHANPTEFIIEDELGEANDTYYVVTKTTKQLSVGGIQPVGAEMNVTWTSANESVAIVSDTGEVTAKRPGQAVITATTQNGLSRTCKIIVCYPVSEISFEQNMYNIPFGGKKQIKALVFTSDGDYINQLVSFSSSDETVATVDPHGIIKALQYGSVTITATAANGVSANCTLNIQSAPSNQYIFSLPKRLTTIESEAFANLAEMKALRIPAGVKYIAKDAFAGSDVIILAPEGSYASEWALDHGMTVIEE